MKILWENTPQQITDTYFLHTNIKNWTEKQNLKNATLTYIFFSFAQPKETMRDKKMYTLVKWATFFSSSIFPKKKTKKMKIEHVAEHGNQMKAIEKTKQLKNIR